MDAGADRDGERQERQPGLERAGAEHVLQVQRGEQEGAEQHGGGGEHHHEAAADARGRARRWTRSSGLRGAQLERGEGGQAGERRGADAERLGRGPAAGLRLGEGVDERAEAGGGQQRAAQVEAAPVRPCGVRGQEVRRGGGEERARRGG